MSHAETMAKGIAKRKQFKYLSSFHEKIAALKQEGESLQAVLMTRLKQCGFDEQFKEAVAYCSDRPVARRAKHPNFNQLNMPSRLALLYMLDKLLERIELLESHETVETLPILEKKPSKRGQTTATKS